MENGKSKVETILQENMMLKEEMSRLIGIIKENEAKQKGFRLVEDAFLSSESFLDIDCKALEYMEEIFKVDKAVLYINSDVIIPDGPFDKYKRIIFVPEKILKYAYIDKKPYFGTNTDILISEFKPISPIGSYLIAPVTDDSRIIASLNIYSYSQDRIPDDGKPDFINDLILRVKITLKKLRDTQIILKQSKYDYMMNIYNKGVMSELLSERISLSEKNGEGFSYLLMDMDNFKELNDTYGHLKGDEILINMAKEFKELLNPGELLGRFGGDELYLILNDTVPARVERRFNEFAKVVDKLTNELILPLKVGISGGYVSIPLDMTASVDNMIEIVKMADLGLYNSKASGKKICSAFRP